MSLKNENRSFPKILSSLNEYLKEMKQNSLGIKALLHSINAMFYAKEVNLKFISANNNFLDLVSNRKDFCISEKNDRFFFSKNEAELNIEKDRNLIYTQLPIINKERVIPGTRKSKWGLLSKLHLFYINKKIIGLVTTFVDITEFRKAEETRKKLGLCIKNSDEMFWIGKVNDNKNCGQVYTSKTSKAYNLLIHKI